MHCNLQVQIVQMPVRDFLFGSRRHVFFPRPRMRSRYTQLTAPIASQRFGKGPGLLDFLAFYWRSQSNRFDQGHLDRYRRIHAFLNTHLWFWIEKRAFGFV